MKIQRIYLETTMFNFYFDTDREAHASTVKLFNEIAEGKYEAYTSRTVIEELEKATGEKRDKMLGLIADIGIPILESSVEAERLADLYVEERVVPAKYRNDGLHIAIAAVNKLDIILSMNFQHIVRMKTIRMTTSINLLNGFKAVEIYSPMEVADHDKE